MRLSILDQSPVTEHVARNQAVTHSLLLARQADDLGYHRIWFAEHHGSASFASGAPEIVTALALERTERIRIGTGGILLPLYQADKVVETTQLLRDTHGDRVDIGVGRAAIHGGDFEQKTAKLVAELDLSAPEPGEPSSRVWMLGSGGSTAPVAAQLNAGYVHGHFLSPGTSVSAMTAYRDNHPAPNPGLPAIAAVRAVTAEDATTAAQLAKAMLLWRVSKDLGRDLPIPSLETVAKHEWTCAERKQAKTRAASIMHGTPTQLRDRLCEFAAAHGLTEIMVNTLTSDPEHRRGSYALLAKAWAT
jgi:alkanesulfonate monooxygenase SsuD/methylene tetrahydromethanopterin reductase-like flavin-dependent oxidoreductase (luciferase family)